jgi:prepilin-type N-terminal cleavage/methylation domain-containing protein
MKQNGFTLIELLVVVAIIGILAAVGTVAYTGYTKNAKRAVVKSNHKMAVSLINRELINSEINAKSKMWRNSACVDMDSSGQDFQWITSGAFSCLSQDPQYKNPFNPSDNEGAFWGSWSVPTVAQVGRIACNYDGNKVICNSRWGTGASDYDTTIINKT